MHIEINNISNTQCIIFKEKIHFYPRGTMNWHLGYRIVRMQEALQELKKKKKKQYF